MTIVNLLRYKVVNDFWFQEILPQGSLIVSQSYLNRIEITKLAKKKAWLDSREHEVGLKRSKSKLKSKATVII